MKNLIKALDKECTIVLPDITTLGTDPDEASSLYEDFPDKGIRMEFTDSPWPDTCSMRLLFKVNPQEAKRFALNNLISTLNWKKNRAVTAKEAGTSPRFLRPVTMHTRRHHKSNQIIKKTDAKQCTE